MNIFYINIINALRILHWNRNNEFSIRNGIENYNKKYWEKNGSYDRIEN